MEDNPIQQKSKEFAVRIVRFCDYLEAEKKVQRALTTQLLRSGTSIGANVRESKNAQSTDDFIHKLNIALKEADETEYWLELFLEAEKITGKEFQTMYDDCCELCKLLTSIINTTKTHQAAK